MYFIANDGTENHIGMIDSEQPYGVFSGELSGWSDEPDFEWCAETGLIGLDIPEYKYVSRVILRLDLSESGSLDVYIEYDSSGKWEKLDSITSNELHAIDLPLMRNRRCDHFRIKIVGTGEVKLYSLTFNIEEGGELN